MKLDIVPFGRIEQALTEQQESGVEQTFYNTKFHTLDEISATMLGITHIPPDTQQPWMLLSPWLDLIMMSQGLSDTDIHRIELSRPLLTQMLFASQVGLYMGRLSESDAEDIRERFPKTTTRGVLLDRLFDGGNKFFVRLDTCSLKDALAGKGPVTKVSEIWMRLTTSARGMDGVRALQREDPSRRLFLYLFTWNRNMDPELEYRVFCPPTDLKIAAISQYKWYEPWRYASVFQQSRVSIAWKIVEGIKVVHQRITAHPAMTEQLKERGFVFDVIEDGTEEHSVQLIELNHFGAMSGCGGCLFHWIRDARILYGLQAELEFRVVI